MASRKVPDRAEAKAARFTHLEVERLASDPTKALEHGQARNGKVVAVLCHVALLRNPANLSRPLGPRPLVTCEAAERQHFRAPQPMQAAHLLPGQIRINGALAWMFLKKPAAAKALEGLFAEVRPLPPNFNKADSVAEANGLTTAFRSACESVLTGTRPLRDEIERAYLEVWVPQALLAYTKAEAGKRRKPGVPTLVHDEDGNIANLEEIGAAGDAQWNIDEQIRILQRYAQSLRHQPWELRPTKLAEIIG